MPALVDSNILYAWRNENDERHRTGREIVEAASDGKLPKLYIPDAFFHETIKHVHNELGYGECIRTMDALGSDPELSIVSLEGRDFDRGRAILRRHDELELADAIALAYMRREGVEHIYSCDDDFDRFDDIVRLNTATNPFGP